MIKAPPLTIKLSLLSGFFFAHTVLANPVTKFFTAPAPSSEIAALALEASMSELGKWTFYQTHPVLMEKEPFTNACNKHEGSAALGCFNGRKIFLFKIPEPQLEYMVAVTAAHEMLHAAYERLDKSERQRIDKLLESAQSQIRNKDILEKIEEYRQRDASVLPSELHSIIGTEVLIVPPELESHYLKYFLNRKALVQLSENYYKDLQTRKDSLAKTDQQLDELKKDIETRAQILRTKQSHLSVLKRALDEDASRERVESYNSLAGQFNSELKAYERLINHYNSLAKERNSRAKENKALYQALDSKI